MIHSSVKKYKEFFSITLLITVDRRIVLSEDIKKGSEILRRLLFKLVKDGFLIDGLTI